MAYVLSYEIENANTIFESPANEPETQFPSIRPTEDYTFEVFFNVFDDVANTNVVILNSNVSISDSTANVSITATSNNSVQITIQNIGPIEPETDLYRFITFTENFDDFNISLKEANTATLDDSVIEWAISSEVLEYTVSLDIEADNIVSMYTQDYLFPDFTPDTATLLDLVSRSRF